MAKMFIDIIARNQTTPALTGVKKNVNNVQKSVVNLKNILLTIAGSFVIREFGRLSNEFQSLQNRLKLVTSSTSELNKVQTELFEISRRTRGGFAETVELYQKLALQSQNLGLSQNNLAQITENVNKVIAIAGVNSIQASSGILQLSQAFASGRLQGDEFRSISENIPPLLDIFAKELKVTRGELKKLGSEGKITSDVIATALLKETENINNQFKELAPTLGQASTRIGNSFLNLVGKFNEVTGVADGLASALIKVSDAMDSLAVDSNQLQGIMFGLLQSIGISVDKGVLKDLADDIERASVRARMGVPDFVALGDTIGNLDREAQKASQSQKRFEGNIFESDRKLVKANRTLKDNNKTIFNIFESHRKLEEAMNKTSETTDGLDGAFRGFKEGITGSLDTTTFDRFKEAGDKSLKGLKSSLTDFVMTGKLNFQNLKQVIIKSIVEALIGSAVSSAIKKATAMFKMSAIKEGLISVYKGALKTFASIPFPFNIGATALAITAGMKLVNKIKGFEKGGAVAKGQPILVGERGPELFMPNQTGQITQSARGVGGEGVNVNFTINTVDASGFEDLLFRSRGAISSLINQAVNEQGRGAVI